MKIAIIGCGAMGGSLAQGLKAAHTLSLYDRNPEKGEPLGLTVSSSLKEAVAGVDMIIIAVKPQGLPALAEDLQPLLTDDQIIVSVIGTATLGDLEELFPSHEVVRAMPNIPVAIGAGVTGLVFSEEQDEEFKSRVAEALKPTGLIYPIPESKLHGLTALAGSGPALIATWIEAMMDVGVKMGLSHQAAQELSFHAIEGTMRLMKETGMSPSEFKWKVASPGGVSIEGVHVLEQGGVRGKVMDAYLAVYNKCQNV